MAKKYRSPYQNAPSSKPIIPVYHRECQKCHRVLSGPDKGAYTARLGLARSTGLCTRCNNQLYKDAAKGGLSYASDRMQKFSEKREQELTVPIWHQILTNRKR